MKKFVTGAAVAAAASILLLMLTQQDPSVTPQPTTPDVSARTPAPATAADDPQQLRFAPNEAAEPVTSDGSIVIEFRNGDDAPAQDVAVVLIKDDGRVWREDWLLKLMPEDIAARGVADGAGIVRFADLPEGCYRWGVDPRAFTITMTPAFEVSRVRREGGQIRYVKGLPQQLSGRIEVHVGEEQRFTGFVHGAIVRGYVDHLTDRLDEGAVVVMYDRRTEPVDGDGGAVLLELERHAMLQHAGEFTFSHVSPGEKLLAIDWRGGEHEHFRHMMLVDVAAAGVHDVGSIRCTGGSLAVSGAGRSRPTPVHIKQAMAPEHAHLFTLDGLVPAGGRFVFHGLPPGEYEVIEKDRGRNHRWFVPDDGPELVLPAEHAESFHVEVFAGAALGAVEVQVLLADGRLTSRNERLTAHGGTWQASFDLPLLDAPTAILARCSGREHRDGWMAFNLVAPGERSASLRLGEASTLRAVVRGLERDTAALAAGPAGEGIWPWATTATDGHFTLRPLLPGMVLDITTFDGSGKRAQVIAPAPNDTTEVEVVFH